MIDVLATLAGLVLLAVPALAVPLALRIRGRGPLVIAVLVCAAADIVGVFIVLSLFNGLTRVGILAAQLLVAAGAGAAWVLAGRPVLRRPVVPSRAEVRAAARAHPGVAFLAAVVVGAMAVQLLLAIAVAPGNWDSMTYHLSRAAYWLQYHSATAYPNGTRRQLYNPPNGEMLQAWTMAVARTDRFTQLVQWTSLVGIAACIYSGARLLRFRASAALFAGLLFAALPEPFLQAQTTQNDLIVTFFIGATAVFGVRGIRDRSLGDLAIAAAAGGLGVGTKGTFLAAVPSLALLFVYALWRFRPGVRIVGIAAAVAVAGAVAFGAFNYVSNVKSAGLINQHTKRVTPLGRNTFRNAWTFVDSPGVGVDWLELGLARSVQALPGNIEGNGFPLTIDTSVQEDTSAFGLVGLLLFLPLMVIVAVRLRSPPALRVVALAALLYFAVFSWSFEYNIWAGRVLIPFVAIGAPLFALLARRAWLTTIATALALLNLVPCVLENRQAPILVPQGNQTVFTMTRLQQQTLIRPEVLPVVAAVDARVGTRGAIGYYGDDDTWDYPFFGEHRERRVVRLSDPAQVNLATMRRMGLKAIVIAQLTPPAGVRPMRIERGYYLFLPT